MKTTIVVLRQDSESFGGCVADVITHLEACRKQVPFGVEAMLWIDNGEYSSEVIISYEREETEAEKQAREAAARATQEMAEKRDRALLKQLLTKYGEPQP